MIIVGSILLVGLRDWEPETARKNCDLLFVYDNLQTASLADRFTIPVLPSTISEAASSSDIIFDNTTVDDHEQLPSDISSNNFTTTDHDFFDDL